MSLTELLKTLSDKQIRLAVENGQAVQEWTRNRVGRFQRRSVPLPASQRVIVDGRHSDALFFDCSATFAFLINDRENLPAGRLLDADRRRLADLKLFEILLDGLKG